MVASASMMLWLSGPFLFKVPLDTYTCTHSTERFWNMGKLVPLCAGRVVHSCSPE